MEASLQIILESQDADYSAMDGVLENETDDLYTILDLDYEEFDEIVPEIP